MAWARFLKREDIFSKYKIDLFLNYGIYFSLHYFSMVSPLRHRNLACLAVITKREKLSFWQKQLDLTFFALCFVSHEGKERNKERSRRLELGDVVSI